jgi:hypothetical protein
VIWAAKTYTRGDWIPVQDLFERQFLALNGPHDMMLVMADNDDGSQTLYLGLPKGALIRTFEGFEFMSESELPRAASLLVGDQSAFEKWFSFSPPG